MVARACPVPRDRVLYATSYNTGTRVGLPDHRLQIGHVALNQPPCGHILGKVRNTRRTLRTLVSYIRTWL
jgi:hypothetical protein